MIKIIIIIIINLVLLDTEIFSVDAFKSKYILLFFWASTAKLLSKIKLFTLD